MPVVPFTQRPSGSFQLPGPAPDEQWSLMAAAQMHTEGRLIQPAASDMEYIQEQQNKYDKERLARDDETS